MVHSATPGVKVHQPWRGDLTLSAPLIHLTGHTLSKCTQVRNCCLWTRTYICNHLILFAWYHRPCPVVCLRSDWENVLLDVLANKIAAQYQNCLVVWKANYKIVNMRPFFSGSTKEMLHHLGQGFLLTSCGRCLFRYPLSKASSRNGFLSNGLSWKKAPILAPENGRWHAASQSCSLSDLVSDVATWADLMWTSGWGRPHHSLEQSLARRWFSKAERPDMAHSLQSAVRKN